MYVDYIFIYDISLFQKTHSGYKSKRKEKGKSISCLKYSMKSDFSLSPCSSYTNVVRLRIVWTIDMLYPKLLRGQKLRRTAYVKKKFWKNWLSTFLRCDKIAQIKKNWKGEETVKFRVRLGKLLLTLAGIVISGSQSLGNYDLRKSPWHDTA
jgi:hypothetical protein